MPRNPINYSNTIIYKIVCKDLTIQNIYVGHTTSFKDRKREHKSRCNNENNKEYNLKIYQFIRENGGWENFDMVEIEKYPCQDSNEARERERYCYELLNANLNARFPKRTHKEYYEDNKEKLLEYFKQRQNTEEYKKYKSEYDKEYRVINKEHKKEINKKYYEDNKAKILEKQKEVCTCCCGIKYTKYHKLRHEITIKHKEYLEKL